jgi:hypothetical protein
MTNVGVFVDEAGDFGFRKTSSKYFVVSYVVLDEDLVDGIESEVGRTLAEANRMLRKKIVEFKFSKNDHATRNFFWKKSTRLESK